VKFSPRMPFNDMEESDAYDRLSNTEGQVRGGVGLIRFRRAFVFERMTARP
jgi:hypothetical protein